MNNISVGHTTCGQTKFLTTTILGTTGKGEYCPRVRFLECVCTYVMPL